MREVNVRLKWRVLDADEYHLMAGTVEMGAIIQFGRSGVWQAYAKGIQKPMARDVTEAEAKAAVEKAAIEALEG